MSTRRSATLAVVAVTTVAAALATPGLEAAPRDDNPYHLKKPGTLVVGMNLQYKPEMYLDASGKPAGYDVVLLKGLARRMKVKLEIRNLDFNGLIPGLVAKQFDMVSVGLTPTTQRRKVVSFSRPYVPYAQVLAKRVDDTTPASIAAWNQDGKTITSLQGSTAEQLVAREFPEARSKSFPDQNAAFLEVASGRAHGIVVETYLLTQFNKSNGNRLARVPFPRALHLEYGAWAAQKGNLALVSYLNRFVCTAQRSGDLARWYRSSFAEPLPPLPSC